MTDLASASFARALLAAHDAASAQHYPEACLYVVATPVGNLADITLRALHVLQLADVVACEDTRHTQALLRAYGIEKGAGKLLALHQHNETQAAQKVVEALSQGLRVAYVSDAGTPGVSDPGARLVAAVQGAGLRVSPLPGPSCVTAALSASGAVSSDEPSFVFAGFLPVKPQARQAAVQALRAEPRTVVMLEAPHRIEALAQALAVLGRRGLTVAREISKQFEEIASLTTEAFPGWLAAHALRTRGEFALVLHPEAQPVESLEGERVLQLLQAELPLKSAVRLASAITGQPRNALYARALASKAGTQEALPADDDESLV